jgi:hypothetical protein
MTTSEGEKFGDVNAILWWAGWRYWWILPLSIVMMTVPVVTMTGIEVQIIAVLALLGIGTTIFGIQEVNASYPTVLEEYTAFSKRAAQSAVDLVGGDATAHTLTYSEGSIRLIEPARRYESTNLVVGANSVTIVEGVGLDMVTREPTLDDRSREVYYDQVASVSYDRPHLEIATSDGGTLEYRSSREPDDALRDLQQRIRAYKTAEPDKSTAGG